VDRIAPESGTARSLIQTSAEALRFPAGSPKPRYRGSSSLRMPAAVHRRWAAMSADPRPPDRTDRRSDIPDLVLVLVLVSGRRRLYGVAPRTQAITAHINRILWRRCCFMTGSSRLGLTSPGLFAQSPGPFRDLREVLVRGGDVPTPCPQLTQSYG
jgi:hypothetical protein